jgi:DNA-binding transcriptional LysR family regulator
MQTGQVEGFVEIAHRGQLGRAADALGISQPALTSRIQLLEVQLNTRLLRRTRQGMALTDAGRAFLPHAERTLDAMRAGAQAVGEVDGGSAGHLRIGSSFVAGTYVLPELLRVFAERHPAVHLHVQTGRSEDIVEMVVRGEVNVGLIRQLSDPRITQRPFYQDELVLVVPPGHPCASTGEMSIDQLRQERLILHDRTSVYYELTDALFRAAGITTRGVIELDSTDAAKALVQRGLGVSFLPETAVARDIRDGALVSVELLRAPRIRLTGMLARIAGDRTHSGAVGAFISLLDHVPSLVPGARPIGRR